MDGYPTPRPLDFTHWAARASAHHDAPELSDPQKMIEGCIESLVPAIVNEVDTLLASAGMAYDAASFGRKAGQITDEMVQGIPPICQCLPKERKHAPYVLSEVYNAGWIVQLHRLEEMEKLFKKLEPSERERQARTLLDDHVLKALESLPITWTWYKKYSTETIPNAGFADRMYDDSAHDRLDILPLLRPSKQIQGNSIDLRLGSYFLFTRRSKQPLYDPRPVAGKPAPDARQFQEMVYVPFGKRFILHPGQFVLGCTFEYIRLPCTLSAHIVGRSSWGRVALVIATATAVSPGYSGVLVLELANLGEHPIALYPGARIAQLVLYEVPRCESYLEGRPSYIGPVRTEYTKLSQDADWEDVMPVDPGEDAG
jgi:dCTP deaminase